MTNQEEFQSYTWALICVDLPCLSKTWYQQMNYKQNDETDWKVHVINFNLLHCLLFFRTLMKYLFNHYAANLILLYEDGSVPAENFSNVFN